MDLNQNIKQFRSTNAMAFAFLIIPISLFLVGIYLSIQQSIVFYILGQICLAFFFFQCFILLHETGHYSFFKSTKLNLIFGHFFAFVSLIPFESWVDIHNLHHRWTGWRDRDPTTEDTVSWKFGKITVFIINLCWGAWIPLFTIAYRFSNYWKIPKLKKYLAKAKLKAIYLNMIFQLIMYTILIIFFGLLILKYLLIGYLISLAISDLFILSQHSHIEMPLAKETNVKALRYADQVKYTRSISFINFVSKFIFINFNLHELHHKYPGLAGYHLNKINILTPNKVSFYNYLMDAKWMRGIDFIFKTSDKKIGKRT